MILHSDMNNFYASVEILYDPTLRDKPVAVAGDEEARHGIVLAKNDIAKRFGIRTGQVLWEARQQCPGLVCVPAHYERYLAFSAQARDIYTSYTDQVESFGLDECWLDVTGSVGLFGEGPAIADDIRGRMKRELGLTVSIGVSFNKVFAKLGSDMKKPDATTVITPENYRDKAWSLPVSDLLYVGPATTRKLNQYGITTIGELAQANPDLLYWLLGKNGIMLHQFANGQDHSGVRRYYAVPPMKSIGNSTTAPRDLVSESSVQVQSTEQVRPVEGVPGPAELLYQGQASMCIVTDEGKVIYIDPYVGEGYDLPADLILVTHAHYDHSGVDRIENRNPDCQIITWKEAIQNGEHQVFDLGYVTVEAVEAGYNRWHDVSECVGYVLTFSNGKSIYVTGDTSTTEQMPDMAGMEIDYAFFCCDGVFNMGLEEAAEAAKLVGAKHNIPYHVTARNDVFFDRTLAEQFNAENRLILDIGETLLVE